MSIAYWEDFDKNYDDFENEGFNLDDLLIGSKLNFSASKTTFTSKSKFNFGIKNSAAHEYSLERKLENGNLEFKHDDSGLTSIEVDSKILSKDKLNLNAYSKFILNQDEENKSLIGNIMLRVHDKKNSLVSFGFEDWYSLEGKPKIFSVYTSNAHNGKNLNFNFNTYFKYDYRRNFLPYAKFLIKSENKKFSGYIQANITRVHRVSEDKEPKEITLQAVDLVAKFINNLDSRTKIGGAIKFNIENNSSEAAIFASHTYDKVKLNTKIDTNRNFFMGISSEYDDITLNLALKSVLNIIDPVETHKKKSWLDFRFGATVEFNRL